MENSKLRLIYYKRKEDLKMEAKKNNLYKYLGGGAVILFVIAIGMFGVSFALWSLSVPQTTTNTFTSGCLKLTLTDTSNSAISLGTQYPISDSAADSLTPYTFSIQNTCSTTENYQVDLDIMSTSALAADYVKYKYDSGAATILKTATDSTPYKNFSGSLTATSAKRLGTGTIDGGKSVSHTLKLWMADSTPLTESTQNKKFEAKIVVTATPKA